MLVHTRGGRNSINRGISMEIPFHSMEFHGMEFVFGRGMERGIQVHGMEFPWNFHGNSTVPWNSTGLNGDCRTSQLLYEVVQQIIGCRFCEPKEGLFTSNHWELSSMGPGKDYGRSLKYQKSILGHYYCC